MIKLENLSKSFGQKNVLHDLNVEFSPGKVYGIVGANGAGKTTLFKCIAGLHLYTGEMVSSYGKIKEHLGFLETNPRFMSRITGWEYLKLICLARGIKEDNFEEQNIFDLPLNEYAEHYSTGMKKKLALMGVLLQKNDVFILDEPFNGVDIQSNMVILELIKKLKSNGKLILIASHIFSTLSEVCDEIIFLEKGSLKKQVKPETFKALEEEMKSFIVGDQLEKIKF